MRCCERLSCRICWAAFSSEGFNIRTYSYQILQYSPSYGTQVTPVTPVGLSTSTIVTGLQLEEAYTYFIKVRSLVTSGFWHPHHVLSALLAGKLSCLVLSPIFASPYICANKIKKGLAMRACNRPLSYQKRSESRFKLGHIYLD